MSEVGDEVVRPKCLVKTCLVSRATDPRYRGLCLRCYSSAKGLVAQGKATWDELVSMGLVLSDKGDPLTEAFNEAKSKRSNS